MPLALETYAWSQQYSHCTISGNLFLVDPCVPTLDLVLPDSWNNNFVVVVVVVAVAVL